MSERIERVCAAQGWPWVESIDFGMSAASVALVSEETSGTLGRLSPHIAEPVITVRTQLRSSRGAHSRDPVAHAGHLVT